MAQMTPLLGDDGELLEGIAGSGSVELPAGGKAPDQRALDHHLQQVFGFTAADLDANQQGKLTFEQMMRVNAAYWQFVLAVVVVTAVSSVMALFSALTNDVRGTMVFGGGLILEVIALAVLVTYLGNKRHKFLLLYTSGFLSVSYVVSNGEVEGHWLKVGSWRYSISARQYHTLTAYRGYEVTVYHIFGKLLSAESGVIRKKKKHGETRSQLN